MVGEWRARADRSAWKAQRWWVWFACEEGVCKVGELAALVQTAPAP
jgi:hypothetical protein